MLIDCYSHTKYSIITVTLPRDKPILFPPPREIAVQTFRMIYDRPLIIVLNMAVNNTIAVPMVVFASLGC